MTQAVARRWCGDDSLLALDGDFKEFVKKVVL